MSENQNQDKNTKIKRIASAEELNQYLKVTRPGGWIVLFAVIALFAGILLWIVLGNIRVEIKAGILVHDGTFTAFMREEDRAKLTEGTMLQIGDTFATFDVIFVDAYTYDKYTKSDLMKRFEITERDFDTIIQHIEVSNGDQIFIGSGTVDDVEDGTYEITVLAEELKPLELLVK